MWNPVRKPEGALFQQDETPGQVGSQEALLMLVSASSSCMASARDNFLYVFM